MVLLEADGWLGRVQCCGLLRSGLGFVLHRLLAWISIKAGFFIEREIQGAFSPNCVLSPFGI